jgi:CheY-specific phosphatase CheX
MNPQTSNKPLELPNVLEFMAGHLEEVFSTMLSLQTVPVQTAERPHFRDRVTGSVGFAGDTVNGVVYLHLSASFANRVAGAMLGLPPEESLSEMDVNDAIGEVTNMLAGGLKSAFCDAGAMCALCPPAIIRGTAFEVQPAPGLERLSVVFDCIQERAAVEIHLRSIGVDNATPPRG